MANGKTSKKTTAKKPGGGVGKAAPVELTFRVISKTAFGLDGDSGKYCAQAFGGITTISPTTRLCPPRLLMGTVDFKASVFNLQMVPIKQK